MINKEETRNLLKALVEAFPFPVPSLTGSFAAKFQCDLCCRYRFLRGLENPILLMVSCAWRGPNPALTATSQWLQETPRLGKSLPSSLIQSLLTLVRCLGDQAVDGGGEMMWLVRKPDEIRVWKGPGVWPVPAEGGDTWSPILQSCCILCSPLPSDGDHGKVSHQPHVRPQPLQTSPHSQGWKIPTQGICIPLCLSLTD